MVFLRYQLGELILFNFSLMVFLRGKKDGSNDIY